MTKPKSNAKPNAKKKAKPAVKAKSSAKPKAKAAPRKSGMAATKARPPLKPNKDGVILLSGGNPQIPKGEGDGPVQAYLAAVPGWKRELARQLDALIVRTVPNVQKAVKWNSPFYGIEGQGWFVSFHCFNNYIKVTFFRGAALRPVPPEPSKDKDTRYANVREGALDEAQMAAWIKQAAAIPGWMI